MGLESWIEGQRQGGYANRIDGFGGAKGAAPGISIKGILVGLVLVLGISFAVSHAELVTARMLIGSQQLPPVVIAVFAFVVLLNGSLKGAAKKLRLSAVDLTMIYCMILVAALISARGIVEKLLPVLVTSNYFSSPSNNWQGLFGQHTKQWMVPFNVNGAPNQLVARRYFEGLQMGERIPWHAWAVPLAAWGMLCLLIIFAFLCLATILRAQWADNERLVISAGAARVGTGSRGRRAVRSSRTDSCGPDSRFLS